MLTLLALIFFVPTRTSAFLLHLFVLFLSSLICHGHLCKLRPAKESLASFYLCIAFGGALGGVFNGLLAPELFPIALEYPLVLLLLCLLRPRIEDVDEARARIFDFALPGVLALLSLPLLHCLPKRGDVVDVPARLAILFVVAAVVMYCRDRPLRFTLALAVLLMGGFQSFRGEALFRDRSYYGCYRVVEDQGLHRRILFNGVTIQGMQDYREGHQEDDLYCYHRKSPIASLLSSAAAKKAVCFGSIGLGVGALSQFIRKGQEIRFFEIDPLVRDIALNEDYFSYVSHCKGEVDVVVGDGRLSLQEEEDGRFSFLVLDAFVSNAIPVHLLTLEAVELYFEKLEAGGICVFHISNRHLDLAPLLAAQSRKLGLTAYIAKDEALKRRSPGESKHSRAYTWVAMARNFDDLKAWLGEGSHWRNLATLYESEELDTWSDGHADLLSYLRW